MSGALNANLVTATLRAAREAFGMPSLHLVKKQYSPSTRTGYVAPRVVTTQNEYPNPLIHYVLYRYGRNALNPQGVELAPLHASLGNIARQVVALLRGAVRLPDVSSGDSTLVVGGFLNDFVDPQTVLSTCTGSELLTLFAGGLDRGLQMFGDSGWRDVEAELGDVVIGAGHLFSKYHPGAVSARYRWVASSERGILLSLRAMPYANTVVPGGGTVEDYLRHASSQVRFGP